MNVIMTKILCDVVSPWSGDWMRILIYENTLIIIVILVILLVIAAVVTMNVVSRKRNRDVMKEINQQHEEGVKWEE